MPAWFSSRISGRLIASRCGIVRAASRTRCTIFRTAVSLARRCGGTTSSTIGKSRSRSANGTGAPVGQGYAHTGSNPFRWGELDERGHDALSGRTVPRAPGEWRRIVREGERRAKAGDPHALDALVGALRWRYDTARNAAVDVL